MERHYLRGKRRSDAVEFTYWQNVARMGAFVGMARLMATKIRIELNSDGIRQLLMSEPIANECKKAAEKIAQRAGEGFEVLPARQMGFGGGRVGYAVHAETHEAKVAEAEDKVLSKAVRG